MENYIDDFLESLESPNTKKVVKNILAKTNVENTDLQMFGDRVVITGFILNTKPNSVKAVTTTLYTIKKYYQWLYENGKIDKNVLEAIDDINRLDVWEQAKASNHTTKKYISNKEFEETCHDIGMNEDYNANYYETLFRALYEGMYSDDELSVIKNLRRRDINIDDSTVTLHRDDGQECKLKVTPRLAEDLYDLSKLEVWERPNPRGICKINLVGLHSDSCFKKEERNTQTDNWYNCYYSKIRKVAKEYLGRPIKPVDIYISGIMHRLSVIFRERDLDMVEAFKKNGGTSQTSNLIERELFRSNYNNTVGAFREMVNGYVEMFVE